MSSVALRALTPISLALQAADARAFGRELGASFAALGFAIVSDHGIPAGVIDAVYGSTKRFFALPEDVKRRYHVPGGGGQRGYTPFGVETAKGAHSSDLKEFWHTGRDGAAHESKLGDPAARVFPANLHVAEIPAFDSAIRALFRAMDALGLRILRAIACYLGLAEDFFENPVGGGNSILRLLHYPPVAPDITGIRAGAHEDINVITLLLGAEEAGLQLQDRGGVWRDINPPAGAVVVNIGDMLQRLTNHALPSTTHRVVIPDGGHAARPRYSFPFFQHFRPDYLIRTLPSCITAENPDRYPTPITADGYLQERLAEIKLI